MQHSSQHHPKRIARLLAGVGIMSVVFVFAVFSAVPMVAYAAEYNVPDLRRTQLEIPIGNVRAATLSEYIILLHQYLVGAAAIITVIFIMFAGYRWLFSAGNKQYVAQAQDIIWTSVVGLFLALTSYVLLYTLNPKTVQFPILSIPMLSDKSLYLLEGGVYRLCTKQELLTFGTVTIGGNPKTAECGMNVEVPSRDPEKGSEGCMSVSCPVMNTICQVDKSPITNKYTSLGCIGNITAYNRDDDDKKNIKVWPKENFPCGQLYEYRDDMNVSSKCPDSLTCHIMRRDYKIYYSEISHSLIPAPKCLQ